MSTKVQEKQLGKIWGEHDLEADKGKDTSFYDPETGLYIPKNSLKTKSFHYSCKKYHGNSESYWRPCLDCEKFCNCNWEKDIPDVIVRTLDFHDIQVNSSVVRGSCELQNVVHIRRLKQEQGKLQEFELDELNNVIDLRTSEHPTYGITLAQWKTIETFMDLHLDRVERDIVLEQEARDHSEKTRLSLPKKEPVNYWGYYDWEEELFEEMPCIEFFELMQAKHELKMKDLHMVLEKWLCIFRGIPKVVNFGKGMYLKEMTKEDEEAGCPDFVRRQPRVKWVTSMHLRIPNRFNKLSAKLWRKRIWNKY